jgi:hypothetical protein
VEGREEGGKGMEGGRRGREREGDGGRKEGEGGEGGKEGEREGRGWREEGGGGGRGREEEGQRGGEDNSMVYTPTHLAAIDIQGHQLKTVGSYDSDYFVIHLRREIRSLTHPLFLPFFSIPPL